MLLSPCVVLQQTCMFSLSICLRKLRVTIINERNLACKMVLGDNTIDEVRTKGASKALIEFKAAVEKRADGKSAEDKPKDGASVGTTEAIKIMLLSPPSASFMDLRTLDAIQHDLESRISACTEKDELANVVKESKVSKAALNELLGITKGYTREVSGAVQAALKAKEQEQKQKQAADKKPPSKPAAVASTVKLSLEAVCKAMSEVAVPMPSLAGAELLENKKHVSLTEGAIIRVSNLTSASNDAESALGAALENFKNAFEGDKKIERAQASLPAETVKLCEPQFGALIGDEAVAKALAEREGRCKRRLLKVPDVCGSEGLQKSSDLACLLSFLFPQSCCKMFGVVLALAAQCLIVQAPLGRWTYAGERLVTLANASLLRDAMKRVGVAKSTKWEDSSAASIIVLIGFLSVICKGTSAVVM
eukprot:6480128-Amphidinium_carterae.4